MKAKWQIGDLIDLEYFLARDGEREEVDVDNRDRRIFLEQVQPALEKIGGPRPPRRRDVLLLWLHARRGTVGKPMGTEGMSPGHLYNDVFRLFLTVALFAGGGTGAGLAFSVLRYNGKDPVNISVYLGLFVLLQIGLLLLLTTVGLLRGLLGTLRQFSLVRLLLGYVVAAVYTRVAARSAGRVSADMRQRLKAVSGFIRGRNRIYGTIFVWPLFMVAQAFGIGFNLGALSASIFKILGADLAFGWQSTLQLSSRAVYRLVEAAALPWSWLLPPSYSHPTYSQVEGSRMVLKEGIYHLSNLDLVAWWPFLLLAVVFYGLLPRMFLCVFGMAARRRALDSIPFTHSACERLMRRMTMPLVETGGEPQLRNGTPLRPEAAGPGTMPDTGLFEGEAAVVLLPEDITDCCTPEAVAGALWGTLRLKPLQTLPVILDAHEDREALAAARGTLPPDAVGHVVVLQEAWQPPIAEILSYFQQLRTSLGPETFVWILLIGRAQGGNCMVRPAPVEAAVWEKAILSLGEPHMDVRACRVSSGANH